MTARDDFDGFRQRAVLTKLQRRAGKEATEAARDVGLSYPQYLRYAWGKIPIRSDQLAAFAAAYGVDQIDLSAELAGTDVFPEVIAGQPQPAPWTFRAALRSRIPEAMIEELAEKWEGRPRVQSGTRSVVRIAQCPPPHTQWWARADPHIGGPSRNSGRRLIPG